MHLTTKQIQLLHVISEGNGEDAPCDLDEILEKLPYETTKQSLQFSIRALISHGVIEKRGTEKRRGRARQVIAATVLGHHMVGRGPAPAVMTPSAGEAAIVPSYAEKDEDSLGTEVFTIFEPVRDVEFTEPG